MLLGLGRSAPLAGKWQQRDRRDLSSKRTKKGYSSMQAPQSSPHILEHYGWGKPITYKLQKFSMFYNHEESIRLMGPRKKITESSVTDPAWRVLASNEKRENEGLLRSGFPLIPWSPHSCTPALLSSLSFQTSSMEPSRIV